jgi:3-hydroxybutyryl-CoA dehydrogenase
VADVVPAVIGVVGTGTMGAGIAQLALEHGHETVIHDVDEAAIERGRERVREGLGRRATRLELDPDTIEAWVDGRLARLREAGTLAALADDAEVVIEAALEDLDLKLEIFHALDAGGAPDTILATNTSSLSIDAIAAATAHPDRVLGLHFFNPAPVMQLVEVVAGRATSPRVVEAAAALVTGWGKTAVLCTDSPGFIVNRVNRPFTIEALRIVEEGAASVEAVDAAIRAEGFPMGPFELMDFLGLDVNLAAATGIWQGLGEPERLVDAGHLGRKTGHGFYRWEAGRPAGVAEPTEPTEPTGPTGPRAPLTPDDVLVRRILLAVINEAYHAFGEGIASQNDIDVALRLGAAHPSGPFERVRAMGGPEAALDALQGVVPPGFQPAPGLAKAASR